MPNVAWIGTGAMGSRMARKLLEAGYPLTVWNRTRGRAEPLAAAGAQVAASPADAVRDADMVVLMLADPAAIQAVTEGEAGLASTLRPGATVIDMSTSGRETIMRLRSVLPESVELLDAPVLGSLTEAETATLRIFVGGSDAAVGAAVPMLTALGTPIHLGPLGTGAAAKLVANSTLLGVLGVLGEALLLADRLGLPPSATWDVLAVTPLGQQAKRRRPAVESGSYPKRFSLSLAVKDADLILGAAEAGQARMRLMQAMRQWLADAQDAGLGDEDYSAILKYMVRE